MAGRYAQAVMVNPHKEVDRSVYPFTLPVFQGFNSLEFHQDVTFFVGENGSGKSTLMEAIAIQAKLPAEGGMRQHSFSTYDSHSEFWDSLILVRGDYEAEAMFLRAESFYNVASYVNRMAREAGGVARFGDIHSRSHGEGFLDAIASLKPPGFYLMDEPESALSFQGQLTLMAHMKRLIDEGSQFVIATHSPILLGFGSAWIYEFSEDGIERRGYRETQNYKMMRDFLENRERYARMLGLGEVD
ncbi:hypothetical protein CCB80_09460 [Armatimonadetes bacterium Uphvl-Ar1]|nr:hypothetical protein CCB80_09460 [Armatimonadetes bacterium Uphvl-Ar1]